MTTRTKAAIVRADMCERRATRGQLGRGETRSKFSILGRGFTCHEASFGRDGNVCSLPRV